MTSGAHVGIDISKHWLDVYVHETGQSWKLGNDAEGLTTLVQHLRAVQPELIAVEASGGYERKVVKALIQAGFQVCVVNPTRVRRFAEGVGILAKTDKIDAKVIAHFASVANLRPNTATTDLEEHLSACVERRRELVVMLTAEKNRLSTCLDSLRAGLEDHIAWLTAQIGKLDGEIQACISQNEAWQKTANLIDAIPGVGPVTAATLVAELPELGRVNRQEIAALAGLAPFNKDSGPKKGRRKIKGGRAGLRRPLYMAVLSAVRWNPVIRPFYEALLKRGKEKKVAITACMRKLLVIMNAMIRKGEAWLYSGT